MLITRKGDGGTMHVHTRISMVFGTEEDTTEVDTKMVSIGLSSVEAHTH